ncbi:PQQ-binding-like beta-propeller repeat protein [Roseiconus nitratireducens]|uniref:PQQ-binding-like beta-propeller repeat protein n=1 Tax=Roseiconus nitratireducens TaxID=2605748 RepID=A0A5M6D8I0_9BACT|nr:PQQ-binding-like beta-propeller repeat protein [Roseiconus nitratireducens]KAA5543653.1 PQQ-binding-like beta-propeller repeat protein [Roseiconus nitratireducens]
MRRFIFVLALTVFAAPRVCTADTPWPQFRGPQGDGIVSGRSVPLEFGEQSGVTWKTEVPGKAWSSPVIADGEIWATTAVEVFPSETERLELLKSAGIEEKKFKQLAVAKSIQLKLLVLDLKTGSLRETIELTQIDRPDPIHSLNSYASPTPVIDGGQIYCHFGTYGTFCIDRQSRDILWHRRLPLDHAVGPGSSPLIDQNRLILIQDGMERQYVAALDKKSGETLWETDRPQMDAPSGDQKKSYCTPIKITDPKGREQLICMGSQWIVAYQSETGEEIWKVRHGKGFSVVPRPVYSDGVVYFCTGFGKPQLWAVRVDGTGDVTDSHVMWTVRSGIPAKPSPILHDGLLYVIEDNGIASCFGAATGETVWKERIGGKYSASPLLVGDRIYLGSHEGDITVIATGREFQVLAENHLEGQIMASPAVVDGAMIWRTAEAFYRIDG